MYWDNAEQFTVISCEVKRFIFSLVPANSGTMHKLLGAIPTEICLLLVMHRYQFSPTDPIPILFTQKCPIPIRYRYFVHIIVYKKHTACYIFFMNYKAFGIKTFGDAHFLIDVLN